MRALSPQRRADGPRSAAGVPTTVTKVAEAVAALNIQLDNLCQFLPQDRVVAFAQMSPCELLLETEKAFGARELHEQHMALIAAKQGMRDLEADVAAGGANLERLRASNVGLERDVERFEARAALLAKAESMRGKLPWLRYEAAKSTHEESRAKLTAAKKSVRAARAAAPARCPCSLAPAPPAGGQGGGAGGAHAAGQVRSCALRLVPAKAFIR